MVACCKLQKKRYGRLREPRTKCPDRSMDPSLKEPGPPPPHPPQLLGADERGLVDGCWPGADLKCWLAIDYVELSPWTCPGHHRITDTAGCPFNVMHLNNLEGG